MDPEVAYLPVDGMARLVHGDLPSMLIGGVSSLLLQMLHPLAMAGVAQHSRYRDDALGRLEQTATFMFYRGLFDKIGRLSMDGPTDGTGRVRLGTIVISGGGK